MEATNTFFPQLLEFEFEFTNSNRISPSADFYVYYFKTGLYWGESENIKLPVHKQTSLYSSTENRIVPCHHIKSRKSSAMNIQSRSQLKHTVQAQQWKEYQRHEILLNIHQLNS